MERSLTLAEELAMPDEINMVPYILEALSMVSGSSKLMEDGSVGLTLTVDGLVEVWDLTGEGPSLISEVTL